MSGIFGFLTPKPARPSMSQPVAPDSSRSPVAVANGALPNDAAPSSTAPDTLVAQMPVSSRNKQRAKPTATAAMEAPRDVFGMTPRPSAKHVYGRKSGGSSADRIPRSQQKVERSQHKKMMRLNRPNSVASPAARSLAIPNLLNSDAPSSGEEEDDIPASAPSAVSTADSIKRPAANKEIQPLFTQGIGAKDTSAMFGPDEEEEAPPTQRRSKAFKKAQAEERRQSQDNSKGKAVEIITAENSSADIGDDSVMDVDVSLGGDETMEPADESLGPADAEMSDAQDNVDDDDNFCRIESLLRHKTSDVGEQAGGSFEILVKWENGEETWEPEEILHEDAPDALFDYWKSRNGRPDNGTGIYKAIRIIKHRKLKKRYQVLVEWLGYPPEDQTWELLAAMKKDAPEIYEEYRKANTDAP